MKKILLVNLLLVFCLSLTSQESQTNLGNTDQNKDSIKLVKRKSGKTIMIHQGDLVKIKYTNFSKYKGPIFFSYSINSWNGLSINKINCAEVKTFQLLNPKKSKRFLGSSMRFVGGTAAIFFTLLGVAIASNGNDWELSAASFSFGLAGIGIHQLGTQLKGRKHRGINKRWRFKY